MPFRRRREARPGGSASAGGCSAFACRFAAPRNAAATAASLGGARRDERSGQKSSPHEARDWHGKVRNPHGSKECRARLCGASLAFGSPMPLLFASIAFLTAALTGCGRDAASPTPLVVRWPPAEISVRREWRAAVVRWRIDAFGRREEGRGAPPAALPGGRNGTPLRVRIELWLADETRPEQTLATFVGEGNWPEPVSLRLWDSRWAVAPASRSPTAQAPTIR